MNGEECTVRRVVLHFRPTRSEPLEMVAAALGHANAWRLKVILTEHRVTGDHAVILRAFDESVGDFAHDWAGQAARGADYS